MPQSSEIKPPEQSASAILAPGLSEEDTQKAKKLYEEHAIYDADLTNKINNLPEEPDYDDNKSVEYARDYFANNLKKSKKHFEDHQAGYINTAKQEAEAAGVQIDLPENQAGGGDTPSHEKSEQNEDHELLEYMRAVETHVDELCDRYKRANHEVDTPYDRLNERGYMSAMGLSHDYTTANDPVNSVNQNRIFRRAKGAGGGALRVTKEVRDDTGRYHGAEIAWYPGSGMEVGYVYDKESIGSAQINKQSLDVPEMRALTDHILTDITAAVDARTGMAPEEDNKSVEERVADLLHFNPE